MTDDAEQSFDESRSSSPHRGVDELRRRLLDQCSALSPALFAWAHLRLRSLAATRVLPEDIVQETWLRALAGVGADESRLRQPDALRAWMFGIAQNVLLEELRRGHLERRPPERFTGDPSTSWLGEQADTVTSICTSLSRHETVERFLDFAADLEEIDRQLLLRCAFEDLTPSDVGRRLGVEPHTAIKRWQRLRERLRSTRLDEQLGLRSA